MIRPLAILLFASLAVAGTAQAGPFADDLSKCLVRSTNAEDKTALVQWMFAVLGLHPEVKQYANVTPEQRTMLNKRMAGLTVSLLTERCAKETREAVKNEGAQTIQQSFSLLGQVAGQEIFGNPQVAAGLEQFAKSIDESKLKSIVEKAN